jgi:hypothetical protein
MLSPRTAARCGLPWPAVTLSIETEAPLGGAGLASDAEGEAEIPGLKPGASEVAQPPQIGWPSVPPIVAHRPATWMLASPCQTANGWFPLSPGVAPPI